MTHALFAHLFGLTKHPKPNPARQQQPQQQIPQKINEPKQTKTNQTKKNFALFNMAKPIEDKDFVQCIPLKM